MEHAGTIAIAGRQIGHREPPYIVAELSANHGGSLDRAFNIIRAAAECGADAVKFQAYTPGSLTIECEAADFRIESADLWRGQSLYGLYKRAATPFEWFPELFACARECGITPLASPFDANAIEMLESLDAPAYKIASFEAVDLELVSACASTGKPVIISTGLCSVAEIEDALAASSSAGCTQIAVLKCGSAYPADISEANLLTISDMEDRFGFPVGYSDHTLGIVTAVSACALGACIIEKHCIDSREPETPDSKFSLLPDELRALVTACREAQRSRGQTAYGPTRREKGSFVFRRSLYAVEEIGAGEELTRKNVRSIRPGYGLPPKYLTAVIGKTATRSIRRGEALKWEMIR